MKRRGRADQVLAALTAPEFQRKLGVAIQARGRVDTTGRDVRLLALPLLPTGALDGVQVTFRWDADRRRVEVRVKGSSAPVDEQAEAGA